MQKHPLEAAAAVEYQFTEQQAEPEMVHRDERCSDDDRLDVIEQRTHRERGEERHVHIDLQRAAAHRDQARHHLCHQHRDGEIAEGRALPERHEACHQHHQGAEGQCRAHAGRPGPYDLGSSDRQRQHRSHHCKRRRRLATESLEAHVTSP